MKKGITVAKERLTAALASISKSVMSEKTTGQVRCFKNRPAQLFSRFFHHAAFAK